MESLRFILLISLGLILALLWNAWQQDYGSTRTNQAQAIKEKKPSIDTPPSILPDTTNMPAPRPQISGVTPGAGVIEVTTDLFRAQISLRGGSLVSLDLVKYPVSLKEKDKPTRILSNEPQTLYVVQGGLLSNEPAPTHDSTFTSTEHAYALNPGAESLDVPLYWESGSGISVKKTYKFQKSRYLFIVQYEIMNDGNSPWTGGAYGQLQRTEAKKESRAVYTYTGAVISSAERRYEKISFDNMRKENLSRTIINGWVAMIQHYFVAAVVPYSTTEGQHYYSLFIDKQHSGNDADRFVIGAATPRALVAPGERRIIQQEFYVGPKIQSELEKIAPGLELTVDYGMLWFLAKPLFWCLQKFHTLTGNWGAAIILVTLMLKVLFFNLSAAGYKSMARMRKVQPRLLAIRDRFKDDRAKLNKAMMDIYKEEKINPLGGCFPILVQIPVFIALYWVLLESIELRQADFGLWIHDLSYRDPYFVLPVIMGLTMLVQQKLNPAPVDPIQEKVMMILPFVFTVFFAFFPSGLVLYWVVNNILSIAQQWLITRNIERAGQKKS